LPEDVGNQLSPNTAAESRHLECQ